MKIKIPSFCWQCFNETNQTPEAYHQLKNETGYEDLDIEFNNDNLYEKKCDKGHVAFIKIANQKFELLFDMGAMALLDGYTKESVSTIASSLERFIEFYIQVIAINNGVALDDFVSTWKLLGKQSERQLGAFYVLQLSEYKKTKFVIKPNWVEFRNKVIHQGYVPSKVEGLDYCSYILNFIYEMLIHMRELDYIDAIQKVGMVYNKQNTDIKLENIISNLSIPTIINLSSITADDFGKNTFKESIESLSNNSFYSHFYSKKFNY